MTKKSHNHQLRLELIRKVSKHINANNLTQREAASLFGVSQPRISDLMQEKIDLFSIDTLIHFLTIAGFRVAFDIQASSKLRTIIS